MKYLLLMLLFASCASKQTKQKNGLVLVDPITNKKYMLQANGGDTFFVLEYTQQIIGTDTTYVFK